MSAFLKDLWELDFLRHALLAGLLVSVACGVIGSFVVVRRITFIASGISHCVLGGMGLARYLNVVHGVSWLHPLHGAVAAALASAVIMGLVSQWAREREDTVISVIWSTGMAVGILFISRTPGYNEDLMSYLFGNILMVTSGDLWAVVVLDLLVLGVTFAMYNKLVATCFDEEFARSRGLDTGRIYIVLLCLTALTVVMLTTVVGIIMVIALLTIPVAMASRLTSGFGAMIGVSVVLCAAFTVFGLGVSYGADMPSGAVTIVIAGACYAAVILLSGFRSFVVRRFSDSGAENL